MRCKAKLSNGKMCGVKPGPKYKKSGYCGKHQNESMAALRTSAFMIAKQHKKLVQAQKNLIHETLLPMLDKLAVSTDTVTNEINGKEISSNYVRNCIKSYAQGDDDIQFNGFSINGKDAFLEFEDYNSWDETVIQIKF